MDEGSFRLCVGRHLFVNQVAIVRGGFGRRKSGRLVGWKTERSWVRGAIGSAVGAIRAADGIGADASQADRAICGGRLSPDTAACVGGKPLP